MAEGRVYYIKVPGSLVEVTEEVYLEYFRTRRRWYAQEERDTYNGVFSYDALDTEESVGEESISDPNVPSVEDIVVDRLLQEKLHHCLALLTESDRQLIHALYFEGMSERKFAKRVGIPQQTISDRKLRTLTQLKKLLEN